VNGRGGGLLLKQFLHQATLEHLSEAWLGLGILLEDRLGWSGVRMLLEKLLTVSSVGILLEIWCHISTVLAILLICHLSKLPLECPLHQPHYSVSLLMWLGPFRLRRGMNLRV
jgi:hypothetical protein